jgi:O-antigen/teichoic acid export membrane protein
MLRAVVKDGGIYTIANFLTKGFSFLLLPLYTNTFLKSTVGIIDILSVFGLFFTSIICFQLNQGMGRYVANPDKTEDEKIRYGSSAILFTSLMYILFSLLIAGYPSFFIKVLSSDVRIPLETFRYAVFGVSLTGIVYFIGVYLRFLRKTKGFAIASILHGVLTTGLIFILVIRYDLGINGVYIAPIISSPVVILVQLYLVRNQFKLIIDRSILGELFIYSLPLIPASVAHVILNFTDRLFIKEYLSFDDLGIYGIGSKFSIIIQIIILSISAAIGPIAFEKSANEKVRDELSRVFRLFIVVGSFGVLALSLFSFETLYIFTNPDYYEAASLMPLFYISVFFGGFSMFSIGLQIEKKTVLIGIVVVFSSAINILLNYILITQYQLMGAAIATLISICINNLTLFAVAQKHYPIKFEYTRIMLLLFILFAFIFAGNYALVKLEFSWQINILIKLILIAIFGLYLRSSKLINLKKLLRKSNE